MVIGCVLTLQSSITGDPKHSQAEKFLRRPELSGTRKTTLLHDYVVFHHCASQQAQGRQP